jgi:ABC-type branched-subunit amino acid transport system ATPase component
MAKSILALENLVISYGGIEAVKGVSLSVNEGELISLIGSNGAGKTTTLKAIAGLLKPKSGKIFFQDSLSSGHCHELVQRGMALVPEGRGVFSRMTLISEKMTKLLKIWKKCFSTSPELKNAQVNWRALYREVSNKCWPLLEHLCPNLPYYY